MAHAPILVGADLSHSADEAIRQAGAWALRRSAPLVAVHAAPDEVFQALERPRVTSALRTRVESILGAGGPALEVVITAGSPHGALVRLADERGAALLVVGAASHESLDRVLFGSTAEQVVRYAHCPVLVARPSPADGVVIGATDFSEAATTAVAAAAEESQRRGVPLRLVHCLQEPTTSLSLLGPVVISPPEMPQVEREELKSAAESTLRSLLEATRAAGACEVVTGSPASAITAEARALSAALVVVATRGRTGLARIALGSVAEAIARTAPCSVLAVRKSAGQTKQ
ncbi:MAG TPA: universal stress protein [Polyangiaceae bacterium]|nr:universal stress protein [Polyangiaceae bacterium]